LQNETVTNIFWGIFLIWFGVVSVWLKGNIFATINHPIFALGTGILLLVMNLVRSTLRLRLSILTIGLGVLLTVFYLVVGFLSVLGFRIGSWVPFLPVLLIIAGIALVIGAFRTRNFRAY
jgi:hypothetical protein